jgi:hypothetical protein
MAETPEFFAPDRFQQVTPSSYLDRANTPEAIGQRKQEIAARLAEKREAQRQAAVAEAARKHETFLQAQQERAQAAADRRAGAQKDHFTFITTTGPNGEQVVSRANTSTGAIEPTDSRAKAGGRGSSGTAQLQEGRMLAAVSEARLADERMREFEDRMMAGTEKITPMQQMGGNLASNLAGSHEVLGAGTQALSEAGLNMTHPSYAQYLRDAATIGRAEQMIMPRGGTETMVRANALLARAGTGANKATIDAARMARQALFGHAGGLEQSMSGPQTERLNAGIARIKSGDVRGGTTAVPSYEEWLKTKEQHP